MLVAGRWGKVKFRVHLAAAGRPLLSERCIVRTFSLNSRDHAFTLLGLKSFTDSEVKKSFKRLQEPVTSPSSVAVPSTNITHDETPKQHAKEEIVVDVEKGIIRLAESEQSMRLDPKSIAKVTSLLIGANDNKVMNLTQYKNKVVALGEKLDPRVWNIGLSFLLTGEKACWRIWRVVHVCSTNTAYSHHSSIALFL
jgi:hypothetical protein